MFEEIKGIQKTNLKTAEIINGMMESGIFENKNDAFVLLRAAMKTLRDRVNPGEAIHLGSQLPALLRGFYFEGWSLSKDQSNSRRPEAFLEEVKIHLNGHDNITLEEALPVALKAILDVIDQGEAVQVLHNLPREIQELCPE